MCSRTSQLIENTRRETSSDLDSEGEFIALNDGGEFSYHASQQRLLESFEYPAEAICIIDRNGYSYGLWMDEQRRLRLTAPRGRVEFHNLRQAWLRTQRLRPQSYPLHRLMPVSSASLINSMFETLQLEQQPSGIGSEWTLHLAQTTSHPFSLAMVDHYLAEQDSLDQVIVCDPFGHSYQPVRHQTHRFLAPAAGYICYEEIAVRKPLVAANNPA
ncbi:hypothetical protein [Psychromicrobium sp. YIM B11713]|uniref:hypothetical protein n=1 Tax=Psychromicrobium sp. YIM B11713 TaxID=3145233 RepID=UPI00374E923F